jgi:hypothetical protein
MVTATFELWDTLVELLPLELGKEYERAPGFVKGNRIYLIKPTTSPDGPDHGVKANPA